MTETAEARFTPQEAAAALTHLQAYEETLTARAFGVTMIAFGLANGATGLTYAFATDWFVQAGVPWLLSFLWLPWIFTAGLLTAIVWHTQSITLRAPEGTKGSWLWFAGFSALYIGIMGLLWFLDAQLSLGLDENRDLITLGLFSIGIGLHFQRRYGHSWMIRTLYVTAVLLLAAGLAFTTLQLPDVPGTMLRVATAAFAWIGAGAFIAHRG